MTKRQIHRLMLGAVLIGGIMGMIYGLAFPKPVYYEGCVTVSKAEAQQYLLGRFEQVERR